MNNQFLTINKSEKDLDANMEHWCSMSYAARISEIKEEVYNQKGYYPSRNMSPIREMVFPVTELTTLEELVHLKEKLSALFGICCFQISINRSNQMAHLLFDFYNRSLVKNVILNRSELIMMSVFIIRILNLPLPPSIKEWRGYMLKCRYIENANVFNDWLHKARNSGMGSSDIAIAEEMLDFVNHKCVNCIIPETPSPSI